MHTATQFSSHIEINYNNNIANAKDILEIMLLGLTQGCWIELNISGKNEAENLNALSSLEILINDYFGEGE